MPGKYENVIVFIVAVFSAHSLFSITLMVVNAKEKVFETFEVGINLSTTMFIKFR